MADERLRDIQLRGLAEYADREIVRELAAELLAARHVAHVLGADLLAIRAVLDANDDHPIVRMIAKEIRGE
jgi:hypothetical protein